MGFEVWLCPWPSSAQLRVLEWAVPTLRAHWLLPSPYRQLQL